MKKTILVGLVLIIGTALFLLLTVPKKREIPKDNKLKVTVSFYPLEFLAESIGGERVIVTNLTPPGAEPHDFEPNTKDIAQLEQQDVIILNGGGIEGYVDKIKENINSKNIELLLVGEPFMSNTKDPHVWIDPVLYMKEVDSITNVFIQKDPNHAIEYTSRSKKLVSQLEELHKEYVHILTTCNQKNIVTSHDAFGYLAKRYGLKQVALVGLSPEEELSAKTLIEVTNFVRKNNVSHIFFEELVSPAIANTIAKETGAKTLILNPVEGLTREEKARGETYITIQRNNLENLQIALSCAK